MPLFFVAMIPGHAMGVQKHTWSPFKSKNSSVRNILQNSHHQTHLMHTLRIREWEKALWLLDEMQQRRLESDMMRFNAVMHAQREGVRDGAQAAGWDSAVQAGMLIYARVTVNTDSTHEMVLSMLKRKIGSGGGTRALLRYVFLVLKLDKAGRVHWDI